MTIKYVLTTVAKAGIAVSNVTYCGLEIWGLKQCGKDFSLLQNVQFSPEPYHATSSI